MSEINMFLFISQIFSWSETLNYMNAIIFQNYKLYRLEKHYFMWRVTKIFYFYAIPSEYLLVKYWDRSENATQNSIRGFWSSKLPVSSNQIFSLIAGLAIKSDCQSEHHSCTSYFVAGLVKNNLETTQLGKTLLKMFFISENHLIDCSNSLYTGMTERGIVTKR